MMSFNLNYIGQEYSWLFYLALLSILQLILTTLLIRIDTNSTNNTSIHLVSSMQKAYPKFRRHVSFFQDHFYWFWNIFPIIFFAHFLYIDYSWPIWMKHLFLLDINDKIQNLYTLFFHSHYSDRADSFILTLVVSVSIYFGYFGQDEKHTIMLEEKKEIYWWSKKFNPKIYVLRKIFLVSNLVLIGFLTYLITKISIFLGLILAFEKLNVFPFHVDGYGGFHFLMEISSILIAMYLLRASMGIIGLDDHKDQGTMHRVGDWINIFYLPAGIILFSLLIYHVKRHLTLANESYNIDQYLSLEHFNSFVEKFKDSSDPASVLNNFNDYYEILKYNSFPIDITMFYNTAFAAVMPISIWFLIENFKGQFTKDMKKDKGYRNRRSILSLRAAGSRFTKRMKW